MRISYTVQQTRGLLSSITFHGWIIDESFYGNQFLWEKTFLITDLRKIFGARLPAYNWQEPSAGDGQMVVYL